MSKVMNGGTVRGKNGEVLTRCYVCGQPYRRLNRMEVKKGNKVTVVYEVCDRDAAQLKRNAKRNKGGE
jgi:uncharacterized C2H2 Zn-finger protein